MTVFKLNRRILYDIINIPKTEVEICLNVKLTANLPNITIL